MQFSQQGIILSNVTRKLQAPTIIKDNEAATTIDLYWTFTSGATYILEQDTVQIYSGSDPYFQATSLTGGNTYAFRVKVVKSGFVTSDWGTLNVTVPLFYNAAAYGTGIYSNTAARQTALEPSAAGVDRAQSWSAWIRVSSIGYGDVSNHIIDCSDNTGSNQQYSLFHITSDNNTLSHRLRFTLLTNSSNQISITTAASVNKGHWHHIVITYDGSEAASGLEMYINGVIESSPTRATTGTYTGAYNSANLRFYISNFTTTRQFTGGIRDLALWDNELDQTKVTALYNSGVPVDVTGVSFYSSDIIAFYPLSSDVACANNATYNLTTTGSLTHPARAIRPITTPISFKRSEIGSTRYIAFGGAYLDGTTVNWYGRSGTTHLANGKLVKIAFNTSTKTAAAPVDVITDGTYDLRGGTSGSVGGSIFVMSSRYTTAGDTFQDSKMYESTDGTTGLTFDSGTSVTTSYTRYNFYGEVVTETIGGTTISMFPYFGHNGSGTWRLSIFKTTDAGANWTKVDAYDGTIQAGEAALVYSNGYWLLLARRSDSPFGMVQLHSTDNGDTWTTPAQTNLGVGATNCSITKNSAGMLQVVYMDRNDALLHISKNNHINDVIADPTTYNSATAVLASYSGDSTVVLGYPNIIHLGSEVYWIGSSCEFSASRADHFFAVGAINESP